MNATTLSAAAPFTLLGCPDNTLSVHCTISPLFSLPIPLALPPRAKAAAGDTLCATVESVLPFRSCADRRAERRMAIGEAALLWRPPLAPTL